MDDSTTHRPPAARGRRATEESPPPRRRRSTTPDGPAIQIDNPLLQLGRLQRHAATIARLIRELPRSEDTLHGTLQALLSQFRTAAALVERMIEARDAD